jgi:hypothetical protein
LAVHIKSNRVRIISRGCHDWHIFQQLRQMVPCAFSGIVTASSGRAIRTPPNSRNTVAAGTNVESLTRLLLVMMRRWLKLFERFGKVNRCRTS